MPKTTDNTLRPSFTLAEKLAQGNLSASACYQCKKCSSGCPLTFAMDLLPHQVIHLSLLGQEEKVLTSSTIWVCSACETCTTRCPNGIDIAGVLDWLKEEALKRGISVAQPEVATFHRYFLESIKAGGGRVAEATLVRRFTLFKLRRKFDINELKENMKLGWQLMKRGRMRLLGSHAPKGQAEIKEILKLIKS
ncbi:MAG: 4Fe-4S dicluster domain-containing protein [Deltaproteobacteria bacterium]|nr:4Fe-4S dicluster domain-containing protein [Deltaproteobacteria bacterium]MBI4794611.1 4Fe-4S dicluster domain-containing protein [Deltaproteobacteria bacterium]